MRINNCFRELSVVVSFSSLGEIIQVVHSNRPKLLSSTFVSYCSVALTVERIDAQYAQQFFPSVPPIML